MSAARRVAPIVLGVLLALLLVGAGLACLAYHRLYRGFAFARTVARTGESIRRHRTEFLEDQAYAAGLPSFARRGGTRDAGPVIGPRIRWVRRGAGAIELAALSGGAIDRGLRDRVDDDWPHAAPELWRDLDFGWMGQLAELDLWDLEQNSVSDPDDLVGPEPDVADLTTWAKLRLARGLHEGTLPAAVAEVEDLARLCFTTERLSPQLAGLALLSFVYRAQRQAGGPPPAPDLGRIRRALYGARAFARLETPPGDGPTFDQLRVGRCAALHDGAWVALLARPSLREPRSAEYRRLEDLLARSPECRLRSLRARWALPDDATPRGDTWWDRALWSGSTAWRRRQGEILVAIGAQDWLADYDRRSPAR